MAKTPGFGEHWISTNCGLTAGLLCDVIVLLQLLCDQVVGAEENGTAQRDPQHTRHKSGEDTADDRL